MSIENVDKAIVLINSHLDEADFSGNNDERLVKLVEDYLEITFPDSYRYFLKKLGCGDISGKEFYGVVNEEKINSGIPDSTWITMKHREQSNLPPKYVIIYAFGDGDYAVLNCEKIIRETTWLKSGRLMRVLSNFSQMILVNFFMNKSNKYLINLLV